ncbi:hypothetical protein [Erwinia tasmaniensis]|uniref:hypothetical protein n=1 Tax=Erwinia tasmaniensis TaxID=338565 RepID=UPI0012FE9BED|nr:hypothetical protein [Erwinia tasmaniensis]
MKNTSYSSCEQNEQSFIMCLSHVEKWACHHAFTESEIRQDMLGMIAEMRLSTHLSGYPAAEKIATLAWRVRDEKFRIVRELGRGDPAVPEMQRLLDMLKRLKTGAIQAWPVDVSQLSSQRAWRYRNWAGIAGCLLMIMSPILLGLLVCLPPGRFSVLALMVYVMLTEAVAAISQDKFSTHFAAITRGVLFLTGAGMILHYDCTTVSVF